MAEEPKKISFGFSKISKKPSVVPQKSKEEKDIQFIDSLEDNSIKLVNGDENGKSVLIIPLQKANVLRDNMIETLKARKEERASKQSKSLKDDIKESVNGTGEDVNKPLTLDEMAAKEILEDLKKTHDIDDSQTIKEIPATNIISAGEKEPTLENYEDTPIQEFGLAVLRGMGWTPESDIGKNGQIGQSENPVLRTKGLGLGADKALSTKTASNTAENLVMKKNAMLKVVSGSYKNLYGKVEGFDELPGRLMVRLTLQNSVISISENLVELVTAGEYNKFSKVLNLDDYNKYHENKHVTVHDDQEKSYRRETRRSPSNSDEKGSLIRKTKNEKKINVSPRPRAEEKYSKHKKVERRSSSSEPDKYFRKSYKNKNRSSSLDSNAEKRKHRNRRDRSSSLDGHYSKRKNDKKRSSSESSESDKTYKKTKKKKQRRSSSISFESEAEERKSKKKREVSDYDRKKPKSRKRHSSSSSGERKYKSRYNNASGSSGSEAEVTRSSKFEIKVKRAKSSKKDKHESNLSPERMSRHKKHSHNHAKNHLRGRSPMMRKKKHHRSRS